jgi:hypothetical protein
VLRCETGWPIPFAPMWQRLGIYLPLSGFATFPCPISVNDAWLHPRVFAITETLLAARYAPRTGTHTGTVLERTLFDNSSDRPGSVSRKSFRFRDRRDRSRGGYPFGISREIDRDRTGIDSRKSFRNGNLGNRYRHPTPGRMTVVPNRHKTRTRASAPRDQRSS